MKIIGHPETIAKLKKAMQTELGMGSVGIFGLSMEFIELRQMTATKLVKRSIWERMGVDRWWRYFNLSLKGFTGFNWDDWWYWFSPTRTHDSVEIPSPTYYIFKDDKQPDPVFRGIDWGGGEEPSVDTFKLRMSFGGSVVSPHRFININS